VDGLALAEVARISPAVTVARQQLFNPCHQVCSSGVQSLRQFEDGCQRWAVFFTFQEADVFGMVAAFKREFLLRQIAFLTQLEQDSRERTLLPRNRFVATRHEQHGVWKESMNSSTKYSIHFLDKSPVGQVALQGTEILVTGSVRKRWDGNDERNSGVFARISDKELSIACWSFFSPSALLNGRLADRLQ